MFSLIVPGRACQTDMTTISPTQSAFSFPATPTFSHVLVFMLPGNSLPADVAAAVYVQLPGEPEFRFMGAIANEKPSALFKVNLSAQGQAVNGSVNVGISVEPVGVVQGLMQQQQQQQQMNNGEVGGGRGPGATTTVGTKVLAQRIIKNAFNFLASFAGGQQVGGQEVVPLKSFEDWWRKFERRIENDPGFLEREDN